MNSRQSIDNPDASSPSSGGKRLVDGDSVDGVDPRVQVELERLNTATDDINKLEVDLDEARATFRELLCESTYKIDALAKKLSSSIEKSRPYYDARFKAKEALLGAQKAAIKFERANSQHAAAKEMVYLAEEGLKTEGRCFDHAWQEMLNHATSRVNESEHERAICEVEHRKTTAFYHKAEHNVQKLQKELKRAISKSSMGARRSLLLINSIAYRHNLLILPYYEMKAHFNQTLEEQTLRVTALEKSVADAKMTYAEALRNLEKISDEIHRTRRHYDSLDCSKRIMDVKSPSDPSKTDSNGSSTTESPDSTDYTSDEYLRLPDKLHPLTNSALPNVEKNLSSDYPSTNSINTFSTEPRRYIKRDRPSSITTANSNYKSTSCNQTSGTASNFPDIMKVLSPMEKYNKIQSPTSDNNAVPNGEEWTEISLTQSPIEVRNSDTYSDEENPIPYKPLGGDLSSESLNNSSNAKDTPKRKILITQKSLPAMSEENEICLGDERKSQVTRSPSFKRKSKLDNCLPTWISRNTSSGEISLENSASSSRRQSLDMLWNSGTGEKVKEFLNQGMMILNISNLTERRFSEQRYVDAEKIKEKTERSEKLELKGRKVPSPLERTINYLNAEDETSDNESLASNEMLTEDQISSLMMEPDINQVCQEILGTPLVEVCPLFQQLEQQQ